MSRVSVYVSLTAPHPQGEEYSLKSDVYSFGIILNELATRRHPFQEFNFADIELETAVQDGTRPSVPADCLPEFRALMTQCWAGEPGKRPAFEQIVTRLKAMLTTHAPTAAVTPMNLSSDSLSLSRSGRGGGLIGVSRASPGPNNPAPQPPPPEPTKQVVVEGKLNKQITGTEPISNCAEI